MNTSIFLKAEPMSTTEPSHITVKDKNKKKIAIIFCDGTIKFYDAILTNEIEQIQTVAKNFWLFYDNLFEAYNSPVRAK